MACRGGGGEEGEEGERRVEEGGEEEGGGGRGRGGGGWRRKEGGDGTTVAIYCRRFQTLFCANNCPSCSEGTASGEGRRDEGSGKERRGGVV